jgi:hypothetical protein
MKQIIDPARVPFAELSRPYGEGELAAAHKTADPLSAVITAIYKPIMMIIAVLGIIYALFRARDDVVAAGISLVSVGIILAVASEILKRTRTHGKEDFEASILLRLRLGAFAEKLGWAYRQQWNKPELAGMPSQFGRCMLVQDVLLDNADKPNIIIGNTTFLTGQDNGTMLTASMIAVRLNSAAKLLFLDSKANATWSYEEFHANTGVELQPIVLEGDFQKYFDLYALAGHEQEALYVFSPELMQVVIDRASHFSIEIAGQWLLMYGDKLLDFSENGMRETIDILNIVGGEFRDNTKRL